MRVYIYFIIKVSSIILLAVTVPAINSAQVNFTSSNLPIIIIDTFGHTIKDEPKITANMKVIHNSEGSENSIYDKDYHYNGFIGIEIRGSSTQNFPKKSYTIETRDSLGNNLNVPLLDLPSENDWVLYAPYSDKSLLRNVLAYKIASDMGHYSPRTKFCELVLNGNYMGVYVFIEKIKRDDNRVNVSNLRVEDTTGVQLSGGYILQIDRRDDSGWYSEFPPFEGLSQRVYYQIVYPDNDEIMPSQYNYIKSFMHQFESMLSNNINDGLVRMLDINSLVDYMIISEFAKNVDAYRLSTYLYKDREDKDSRIHIGPVWDFNLAFGNADYYRGQFNDEWHIKLNNPDVYQPPFWFEKLWDSNLVQNMISSRWHELRKNILSNSNLIGFVTEQKTILRKAADRNFAKWNILGAKVWPNPFIHNTYDGEIDYLQEWLEERSDWIDKNVIENYSAVDWNNETLIYTDKSEIKLPRNYFYSGLSRIDSVSFISMSDSLEVIGRGDTISIKLHEIEGQSLIVLAYYFGELVDVSPLYTVTASVTSTEEDIDPPSEFNLMQNYPNPFNPSTTIEYTIPANSIKSNSVSMFVTLKLYDILGREVAWLVNDRQRPGKYRVNFSGTNIASGIYFYTLQYGNLVSTKKMLLVK